jgi:hypothetical protein
MIHSPWACSRFHSAVSGRAASRSAGPSYATSERYERQWIEYSRTASELRRLLERRVTGDGSPLSGPNLVAQCEQVISVQTPAHGFEPRGVVL